MSNFETENDIVVITESEIKPYKTIITNGEIELNEIEKINQHGTDAIKEVVQSVFAVLDTAKDTFSDGVQITDVTSIFSFWGELKDIGNNYAKAYTEIKDLDLVELQEVTKLLSDEAIGMFWVDNGVHLGETHSIDKVLQSIYGVVTAAKLQLQDGFQINDLALLPVLLEAVLSVVKNAPGAVIELGNLGKEAISELVSKIVVMIAAQIGMK